MTGPKPGQYAAAAFLPLVIPLMAASYAGRSTADELDTQEYAVYRSSVLGISIEYPKRWIKSVPVGCGSGMYKPRRVDQVLKNPIRPISFSSPDAGAGLSVVVQRRFDGTAGDRVAVVRDRWASPSWSRDFSEPYVSDFTTSCGAKGKRLESLGRRGIARFVVVTEGRLVELEAWCSPEDWLSYEPVFDRMASTLVFSTEKDDVPRPGKNKVCSGPGFSFEYPGEWWLARRYDDDEEFSYRHVVIYDTYLGLYSSAQLKLHKGLDPQAPREWLNQVRRSLREAGMGVRESEFVTDGGLKGIKVRVHGRRSRMLYYVFPGEGGSLWALGCTGRFVAGRVERTMDRVARSLIVE